jgi:hypothetical protein
MNDLTLLREAGPDAPLLSPAARSAARAALLAEIDGPVRRRSRRIGRKAVIRVGLAAVTAAAAWAGAVAITGPDAPGSAPGSTPPAPTGITLVATQEITFPLSLDPAPQGLDPVFTGGPGWGTPGDIAGYQGADGTGFSIYLQPDEPTWAFDQYDGYDVSDSGTTTVGGTEARYVTGKMGRTCTVPTTCFDELPFAGLVWQRAPGKWVYIAGTNAYGNLAAVVAVADSLVDRPQRVDLQVGLAPAGWSAVQWHNSNDVVFANDADPSQMLMAQVQAVGTDDDPIGHRIAMVTPTDPVVSTEVHGRPAELVRGIDRQGGGDPYWMLAWQLPTGELVTVDAPAEFSEADVLAIARGVTYTP